MKIGIVTMIMFIFIGLINKTYAEKYYVYDGSTFNVMITCDEGNTIIQKVSFSANNEWNDFAVVCRAPTSAKKW
jgi:hypothetical protein